MNEPDPDPQPLERLAQLADDVAVALDADIILYNGATYRIGVELLVGQTDKRRRRTNALLILVTQGGDADSAYRIARWLQSHYEKFILFVSGYCKSAGTLVATGAHELVMSKYGELGPLDVQMSKRDELSESQSGLAVQDTLDTLQHHALETFVATLLEIKRGSRGAVSLKMATEIATSMTTGLFAPIYGQVDPLHVGESARAMNITSEYGERLLDVAGNIGKEELGYIISGYPSHSFVIDRDEATQLFRYVRPPTDKENDLTEILGEVASWPVNPDDQEPPIVQVLSTEPIGSETENDASLPSGGTNEQATHGSQHAPAGVAQNADPQPTENGIGEGQPLQTRHIGTSHEAGVAGEE